MGSHKTEKFAANSGTNVGATRFAVNPLSKAVRGVLFASSAAMALSGPMVANAAVPAECTTVGSTTTCLGIITESIFPAASAVDLTVVVGDVADPGATTVTTDAADGGSAVEVITNAAGADAVVTNYSAISADTYFGIEVDSYADALVTNNGSVSSTDDDWAAGIYVYAGGDDLTINGAGSATAVASNPAGSAGAMGIWAYGPDADISISGQTTSGTATAGGANSASAYGSWASGDNISIDGNTDSSAAYATAAGGSTWTLATWAYSNSGDISITNTSSDAYASADDGSQALGAWGWAGNGDVSMDYVAGSAEAVSANGSAWALGTYANSNGTGDTVVSNSSGDAIATAPNGSAEAYGVWAASGSGTTDISNTTGTATATGDYAEAVGIYAAAWSDDLTISDSTGTATATSTGADANASGIYAFGDDLTITNSTGTATATAGGSYWANAYGIQAVTDGGDISIDGSTGTATGTSTDAGGNTWVLGVYAETSTGEIDLTNSTGTATTTAYNNAQALGVWANIGDSGSTSDITMDYVTGSATATSTNSSAWALGIYAEAEGSGDVDISNSTGTATATGLTGANAYGIWANAENGGDVTIDASTGTATGTSTAGSTWNIGIYAYSDEGDTTITNSTGTATSTAYSDADAYGIWAVANAYDGDVTVSGSTGTATATTDAAAGGYAEANGVYTAAWTGDVDLTDVTGTATATGYNGAGAYGVYVFAYDDATLVNVSGTGTATSLDAGSTANSYGIYAYADAGDLSIDGSSGTASSTGNNAWALGVYAESENGDVTITNTTGTATGNSTDSWSQSLGVRAQTAYAGDVTLDYVTGTATDTSTAYNTWTLGIYAEADGTGDVNISNSSGTATGTADGRALAYGVWATADDGDVSVATTTGTATATANTDEALAFGLYTASWTGDLSISDSTGTATATSTASNADATGVYATAYGDITLSNVTGNATATALAGYAEATGIYAYTFDAAGAGDITASGLVGNASATGLNAYAGGVDLYSAYGSVALNGVSANASATGADTASSGAYAIGVLAVSDLYDASVVTVAGDVVSATATATATDALATAGAQAIGLVAAGNDYAGLANGGSVQASATATADYSFAQAIGALAYGQTANVSNTGSVSATATADDAYAIGLVAYGQYTNTFDINGVVNGQTDLTVTNDGGVYATANGVDSAIAVGVNAASADDTVTVVNEANGVVVASATADAVTGYAISVAVLAGSSGDVATNVTNYGTIAAYASGYDANAYAVFSQGDAVATILNYGTMTGAIRTGDSDDYIGNFSSNTWNATGNSYLGAGDDVVYNSPTGRIVMTDANIYLGGYAAGNEFINRGLLEAFGDNLIDMGNSGANPLPFDNYDGEISLVDGAYTTDTLTILGDFSGGGDSMVNVDIDGYNQLADLLVIDGNVIPGLPTAVGGHLTSIPNALSFEVDVIEVTGDSVSGDFVIGDVTVNPDSFLAFDFALLEDIDGTNVDNDIFSIGVNVAGLSDPGVLVSSLSPAVQGLWQNGVGTLHQRQGAVRDQVLDKLSVWFRTFASDGTMDPDGAQNNLEFDQENVGYEVGIDAALNDEWRLGLLFGHSEADVSLNDASGGADIDGTTVGIYLTWLGANGWYSDLSYRRMDFDGDATSTGGKIDVDGEADGWNLEVGKTMVLASGLVVEPQFQYTDMEVDLDDITNSYGVFSQKDGDSTRARLGVLLRKTYQPDVVKWTPYGSLSVVEEFDGENSYAINSVFEGDSDMGGTSMLVETGVNAQFDDVVIYGGLNYQDGDALDGVLGGQMGIRFTW